MGSIVGQNVSMNEHGRILNDDRELRLCQIDCISTDHRAQLRDGKLPYLIKFVPSV